MLLQQLKSDQETIDQFIVFLSHARDKKSDEMNNYYEFYFNA